MGGSVDDPNLKHAVLELLHERKRKRSKPGARSDKFKVALCIEGGGMRGCVSAGMVAAINELGLRDSIDVVYGSSAGSLIGAYFITGQLPYYGVEVYYDELPTAGKRFIDVKRMIRAMGLGILNPFLLRDKIFRGDMGKPVLNLDYLLRRTAIDEKPLDWETFEKRQSVQPLKIIATAMRAEKSVVFDMEHGHFSNVEEMASCMHASCLLPGISGEMMNIITAPDGTTKFVLGNNMKEGEPLADALGMEPLPYRTAIAEGCTHILVLRTRADGVPVAGNRNFMETSCLKRFLLRKNNLPLRFKNMQLGQHKYIYAKDVVRLNDASNRFDVNFTDVTMPHIMTLATPKGTKEVSRLETKRKNILNGVKSGFARAYDALVENGDLRGKGFEAATETYPDKILEYDPTSINAGEESAFEAFLRGTDPDNIPNNT